MREGERVMVVKHEEKITLGKPFSWVWRVILKLSLENQDEVVGTGFIWPRVGTSHRVL
jgi:hypothetical protein